MKSTLIILALFMLAVQGEAQTKKVAFTGWVIPYNVNAPHPDSINVTTGEARLRYPSIAVILSIWDEWRDSCYADSSGPVVTIWDIKNGTTEWGHDLWHHSDPNDLPAFMEFLRRRKCRTAKGNGWKLTSTKKLLLTMTNTYGDTLSHDSTTTTLGVHVTRGPLMDNKSNLLIQTVCLYVLFAVCYGILIRWIIRLIERSNP